MKILLLAITLASASLTACGARTSETRPNADAFLQPTVIEGKHRSLAEVMRDPAATTRDLTNFAGAAEDAVQRANADKSSARRVLVGHDQEPR